jgi:hypothetical protein
LKCFGGGVISINISSIEAPSTYYLRWCSEVVPEVASPDMTSPEVASPEMTSSDVASPDMTSPEVASPEMKGR